MIKRILAVLLFALLAPMAHAQHGTHMKDPQSTAVHRTTGMVKSVDAARGTVSIAHEPVESLKWPAMTMTFKAQDRKALAGLAAGKKVEFSFVQRGKDYVITQVK